MPGCARCLLPLTWTIGTSWDFKGVKTDKEYPEGRPKLWGGAWVTGNGGTVEAFKNLDDFNAPPYRDAVTVVCGAVHYAQFHSPQDCWDGHPATVGVAFVTAVWERVSVIARVGDDDGRRGGSSFSWGEPIILELDMNKGTLKAYKPDEKEPFKTTKVPVEQGESLCWCAVLGATMASVEER